MSIAITREVSRAIEHCELTYLDRTPLTWSAGVSGRRPRDYARGAWRNTRPGRRG